MNAYMGLVVNKNLFSGVIIDDNNNIITKESKYVGEKIFKEVKELISTLLKKIKNSEYMISNVGVTGDYRKIIGNWLGASICNEIESIFRGNEELYKVNTIVASDLIDVKIIKLKNYKLKNYEIKDKLFYEDDILSKIYNLVYEVKDDILITGNIVNNNKIIMKLKELCRNNNLKIDKDNITESIGIALIGKDSGNNCHINNYLLNQRLSVKEEYCNRCNNKCNMVYVLRGDTIINSWGNKCEKGEKINI